MIMPSIHVHFIELSMPTILAFRSNIVASALQARDMTLGPHHHFPDELHVTIKAIGSMIQAVSPLLVRNWVTAYVKPARGHSQLLTTYKV